MQTALISAVTAAVVTLFIEYLAKPRLEARKTVSSKQLGSGSGWS
jgi:hypothetical protein